MTTHGAFMNYFSIPGTVNVREYLVDVIINTVAEEYGLRPEDLKQKSRKRKYLIPKYVAMYLIYENRNLLNGITQNEIGRVFRYREHSAVSCAITTVSNDLKYVDGFKKQVDSIRNKIRLMDSLKTH